MLLYATHPLILVIICVKYGKNPPRTVDFFFEVKAEKLKKIAKNSKHIKRDTPSNNNDHLYQI